MFCIFLPRQLKIEKCYRIYSFFSASIPPLFIIIFSNSGCFISTRIALTAIGVIVLGYSFVLKMGPKPENS